MNFEKFENQRKKFNKDYISMSYASVYLFKLIEIEEAQLGYSANLEGNDLTGENEGDWKKSWIVIASDELVGDPIFVDIVQKELPVYTAMHGLGSWDATKIADTIEGFFESLNLISRYSEGRDNPEDYKQNPIGFWERRKIIKAIKRLNPKLSMGFWKEWFKI